MYPQLFKQETEIRIYLCGLAEVNRRDYLSYGLSKTVAEKNLA